MCASLRQATWHILLSAGTGILRVYGNLTSDLHPTSDEGRLSPDSSNISGSNNSVCSSDDSFVSLSISESVKSRAKITAACSHFTRDTISPYINQQLSTAIRLQQTAIIQVHLSQMFVFCMPRYSTLSITACNNTFWNPACQCDVLALLL